MDRWQRRLWIRDKRVMAGVETNLDEYHESRCKDKGYHLVTEREESQSADAVGLLLRERLTGKPSPDSAQPLMNTWRSWLEDKAGKRINELKSHLHDQEEFGETIRDILEDLELPSESEGEGDQGTEEDQENAEDEDKSENYEVEQDNQDAVS